MTDIQISSPKDSDWEWIKEKHAETTWSSLPPSLQSAVTLQTVRANLTGQTAELLREHGKSNQVFTARMSDGELAGYIWVGEIKSGFTGAAQMSLFVGPVLAGVLISWLDGGATGSTSGIAIAIALDAFSFLASITMLSLMKIENAGGHVKNAGGGVVASIREGLLYTWNDATLRIVFPITLGLNILINGPFAVGLPVMARTRFPEGAVAFGLILSVFGGGALLGITLAGVLPKPSNKLLGTVSLSVISAMGIGLAVIGVAPTMYIAAAAALMMGTANGYANIMLITWLQQKVAPEMTGRVMSLVMFAAIGFNPVSNALAGVLIGFNATVLLVCAGILMTLFTLSAAFSPAVRVGME